jgi:thioredoxin 1
MKTAHLNFNAVDTLNDLNFGREVVQSQTPVLVLFWAYGCPLERTLLPLAKDIVSKHSGKFRIYKVNLDENPFLADHFHLHETSALLLFQEGKVVGRRLAKCAQVGAAI